MRSRAEFFGDEVVALEVLVCSFGEVGGTFSPETECLPVDAHELERARRGSGSERPLAVERKVAHLQRREPRRRGGGQRQGEQKRDEKATGHDLLYEPRRCRASGGGTSRLTPPGADRITTAIFQVLVNYIHFGMPLPDAVAHARAHVEQVDDDFRVAIEPGLPRERITLPQRPFDQPSMYFGGAAAATWSPESGFEVAGDPRRKGGTAIVATG